MHAAHIDVCVMSDSPGVRRKRTFKQGEALGSGRVVRQKVAASGLRPGTSRFSWIEMLLSGGLGALLVEELLQEFAGVFDVVHHRFTGLFGVAIA